MLVGLTEMEAVGAGGGGGGGGGGVAFFLHAPNIMMVPKTIASANHFVYLRFIFCPLTLFFQTRRDRGPRCFWAQLLFACHACRKQV